MGSAWTTARAPAKINLELVVGGPGADGFHQLATVFQAVSLHDDVSVRPAGGFSVSVVGPGADGVPTGEANLAVRAARLVCQRSSTVTGVEIEIRKEIPVAGGMAGGSADAAAALIACDHVCGTGLSREELAELGSLLGADVPFALLGGTALGAGRGDRLTAALASGRYHWVLAIAAAGLATSSVYGELDRLRSGRVLSEPRTSERLMQALRSGDAVALGAALHNDMAVAARSLAPHLDQVLEVGESTGVLGSVVSGSGPTVAFLVVDEDAALDLVASLEGSGVVERVSRVHGPVHGARLLESVRA